MDEPTSTQQALDLAKFLDRGFLSLGAALYFIKENKSYLSEYKSFNDFCAKLYPRSQGSLSKLVNIYKTFVIKYKFPIDKLAHMGYARLADILPYCANKTVTKELMQVSMSMSREGLRRYIKR